MKEFFPNNRVEYFISNFDYYRPEAYKVSSDTYIEKDASQNEELDQMSKLIKEWMEKALNLRVPVKVEIGTGNNWLEAH